MKIENIISKTPIMICTSVFKEDVNKMIKIINRIKIIKSLCKGSIKNNILKKETNKRNLIYSHYIENRTQSSSLPHSIFVYFLLAK